MLLRRFGKCIKSQRVSVYPHSYRKFATICAPVIPTLPHIVLHMLRLCRLGAGKGQSSWTLKRRNLLSLFILALVSLI